MDYFNREKLHKQALTSRSQLDTTSPVQPIKNDIEFSFTNIHEQAWVELSACCSNRELEKLSRLAWQYESGKRKL
jgi:hypothetical protein